MNTTPLSVAVPWSLSHYIPLGGFNPLYRALFDECPEGVKLNAWDNILLHATLRQNPAVRQELLGHVAAWQSRLKPSLAAPFKRSYYEAFYTPNLAATALLPGDIELHHTGLFPSMTRPFVLLCDSFTEFFTLFTEADTGAPQEAGRAHYAGILEHELCLGIFSHIPQTLEAFRQCFQSQRIDAKLFLSRIGILQPSAGAGGARQRQNGGTPVFFCIGAGPDHVIEHGLALILQAWPAILAACPGARLYLYASRPEAAALTAQGADTAFIAHETGKSLIWIPEYLTNHEILRLMQTAHFLLLPSITPQSVAIMQAMALGAVPVVPDTTGNTHYVSDGETGIVLQDAGADKNLAGQLVARVTALWQNPTAYAALQARAIAHAEAAHNGARFAEAFWAQVQELWAAAPAREAGNTSPLGALQDCLVSRHEWQRLFESPAQPRRRLYTGAGLVTELGGSFIATPPNGVADVHGWSVLAEHCRNGAVPLRLAASIDALEGAYMGATQAALQTGPLRRIVEFVSQLLSPYPILYRAARKVLRLTRRLRGQLQIPAPPELHDVQLLRENVAGMNVLRCDDLIYAIPQDQGAFSLTKLRENHYRVSFSGNSLREVLDQIAAYAADPLTQVRPTGPIELLEEGFHGLNLLRYGDVYLAIPQGEGAFDYDRVLAKGYSRSATASSLTALKTSIIEVLS
jgi:glycosyltransferase involved in cell wall biosynthesis